MKNTIKNIALITTIFAFGAQFSLATLTTDLQVGSRGVDVTTLQNFLKGKGFFTVEATGYFGAVTKSAVEAYQSSRGISSVGRVGPLTRNQINMEMSTVVLTPPTPSTSGSLDGNSYVLSLHNNTPTESKMTLNFEQGRLGAKICNSMGGEYYVDQNNKLIADKVFSTMMYCFGQAGEIEDMFTIGLNAGLTITARTADTLILTSPKGDTFVFVSEKETTNTPTLPSTPVVADIAHLGTLRLVGYKGEHVAPTANSGAYTLVAKNGVLSLSICNTINANYTFSNGIITAPFVISGSKFCNRDLDIENAFVIALKKGLTSSRVGDTVTLSSPDGISFEFKVAMN